MQANTPLQSTLPTAPATPVGATAKSQLDEEASERDFVEALTADETSQAQFGPGIAKQGSPTSNAASTGLGATRSANIALFSGERPAQATASRFAGEKTSGDSFNLTAPGQNTPVTQGDTAERAVLSASLRASEVAASRPLPATQIAYSSETASPDADQSKAERSATAAEAAQSAGRSGSGSIPTDGIAKGRNASPSPIPQLPGGADPSAQAAGRVGADAATSIPNAAAPETKADATALQTSRQAQPDALQQTRVPSTVRGEAAGQNAPSESPETSPASLSAASNRAADPTTAQPPAGPPLTKGTMPPSNQTGEFVPQDSRNASPQADRTPTTGQNAAASTPSSGPNIARSGAADPALAKNRWKGGDDQPLLRAESPQPDLARFGKPTPGNQNTGQYTIQASQSQSLLTSTAPLASTALEDTAHSVALDNPLPGGEVLGTGAASVTSGALAATGSANGSALAGQVANQITYALPRQDGLLITPTTTEIALDPPELGKLRIVVSEGATGINIAITAERGETADLMRRHIDLLRQEFAREGVTGGSIEFNQGDPSQRGDQNSSDPEHSANGLAVEPIEDATPLEPTTSRNHGRTASGGLDLRL